MGELLSLLFCFFNATLSGRCNLALENLALRQQLAILKRTQKRPAINTKDRLFWVWLSRIWSEWRASLLIIKPDTVIGWHRKGFRLFWTKLSRRKIGGRPESFRRDSLVQKSLNPSRCQRRMVSGLTINRAERH
jgi:hypothetical protein